MRVWKPSQSFRGRPFAVILYRMTTVTYLSRRKAQFVKCDVRNWDDQVLMFEMAIKNSPHNSCDIVIANAGVVGKDDMFTLQGVPPVLLTPNILSLILSNQIPLFHL